MIIIYRNLITYQIELSHIIVLIVISFIFHHAYSFDPHKPLCVPLCLGVKIYTLRLRCPGRPD